MDNQIKFDLDDLSEDNIINKKDILIAINCTNDQVSSILKRNPLIISKTNKELVNILKFLLTKGFNNLSDLIDTNPFILNLDPYEIDNYINKRIQDGELLENIIDELASKPNLFDEM